MIHILKISQITAASSLSVLPSFLGLPFNVFQINDTHPTRKRELAKSFTGHVFLNQIKLLHFTLHMYIYMHLNCLIEC